MTDVTRFVEGRDGGVEIAIKAVPGAGKDEIVGLYGNSIKVKVAAQPERGRANRAIEKLIAGWLGVPVRRVSVIAGQTSRDKRVRVEEISMTEVELITDDLKAK